MCIRDSYKFCLCETRLSPSSNVFEPDNFAPDPVGYNVRKTVVVEIGNRYGGVAPLGFARSLYGTIFASLEAYDLCICLQVYRLSQFGFFHTGSGEVFYVAYVAGSVATK